MIVFSNCLTSYAHVSKALGITSAFSGTSDPDVIKMSINDASDQIERYCARPLKYDVVLGETHDGVTQKDMVFVTRWPILSLDDFYDDPKRDYTSISQLTVANDEIEIFKDFPTKTVRNQGIIRRIGAKFNSGQANLKMDYKGGFSEFRITPKNNNFQANFGAGAVTVTIANGFYTALTLPTAIDAGLESAAGTSTEFTVSYDHINHLLTMAKASGTFSLLWDTGNNVAVSDELADLLGFSTSADLTGALTYTSDESILGVPWSLESAALELSMFNYMRTKENWTGKTSENRGEQSYTFDFGVIPQQIKGRLNMFKRRKVA